MNETKWVGQWVLLSVLAFGGYGLCRYAGFEWMALVIPANLAYARYASRLTVYLERSTVFTITRPDGTTLAERQTREEAIRVALFNANRYGPLKVTGPDGKPVATTQT